MIPTQDRIYQDSTDDRAKALLDDLLKDNISVNDYQESMINIGNHLGERLKASISADKKYCLIATAEDADFLVKGIIKSLKGQTKGIYLTCFWNERSTVNESSVAPIYNTYFEPGYDDTDEFIVVKSIMSGSCVVKTNIAALYDKIRPTAIHVVAPVMHTQSEKKLRAEFPDKIANLIDFTFLAKDSQRDEITHVVIPGIGGDVYTKLGFKNQQEKNAFFPEIIQKKLFATT